jgi:predicted ABC-type transport system involved in lysophospholipase L1 biosynthesis ATPase subunit
MMDVLGFMNREHGMTLVTVTHDRRCADALSDRTLRMEPGGKTTMSPLPNKLLWK